MCLERLANRDAIYDALASGRVSPVSMAMRWAHESDAPELSDLWAELRDHAKQHPDSPIGRALLVVVDAHLESKREAA